MQSNPELLRDRALSQRARSQLSLEKSARLPTVALKAGLDQDPEVRSQRVGVVLSIPILDQRVGPVGEAAAELKRTQLQAQERELNLKLALEAAYRQVEISRNQVTALESGILRQAENALRVAEAAYRYGERGILDYLDAQRVYRNARNELIAARFDLRAALIEIERLQSP
jgi:cobalt-zinc-cadmium efflux system outer membrane protein